MNLQQKLLASLCTMCIFSPALHAARTEPSTESERTQAIQYAHDLESNPLGSQAPAEREWLKAWIIAIPDIEVPVCNSLLTGVSQTAKQHGDIIYDQMAYSSVAFMIMHPEKSADMHAIHLAGIEGSLLVYEVLLKKSHKFDQAKLDELLQARDAGALTEALQKQPSGCMQ